MTEFPCKRCTRVKAPVYCTNKDCQDWRAWFLGWWEAMREKYIAERSGKHEKVE